MGWKCVLGAGAREKQVVRRWEESLGGGGGESFPGLLQVWKGKRCPVVIGGEWISPKG